MLHGSSLAAGYRRYDIHFAAAQATADGFTGLGAAPSPSHALAAFKRAARAIGASGRLVELIDLLFAWTKPQDWADGQTPIVWPKNETLAEALGLEVRQVQNLLRRAVELRLISHRDSPNGHRGGTRDAQGQIRWAYGIDLRPIGTRMGEFRQLAEAAALEARQRDELRRRLTIARKAIAQIAQTALECGLADLDWLEEADTARLAAEHARGLKSLERLTRVVEDLEVRMRRVKAAFIGAMADLEAAGVTGENPSRSVDSTPTDAADCMDYTTTTDLLSAQKAELRNRFRGEGSDLEVSPAPRPPSPVEADLERYGIDVDFIGAVCREVCWELDYGRRSWGDLVAIAERRAAEVFINDHTWREACRIMGRRGAAAAVIATIHKERAGLVQSPGAYLRGMTQRATIGELQLGRTFHGLREEAKA